MWFKKKIPQKKESHTSLELLDGWAEPLKISNCTLFKDWFVQTFPRMHNLFPSLKFATSFLNIAEDHVCSGREGCHVAFVLSSGDSPRTEHLKHIVMWLLGNEPTCHVLPPPARAATWQPRDDFLSFNATECCWQSDLVWSRRFLKINMSLSKDLEDNKARSSAEILEFRVTEAVGMSRLWFKCSYACSCTHTRRNTQLQCCQHTWTILKAFFPGLSVNNEGWNRRWTKHVVLFWRLKLSGTLLGEFLQCLKYVYLL